MKKTNSQGFAMVILLFLMLLTVTIITAAVSLIILDSSSSTLIAASDSAKSIADSCMENAVIRLIRDPAYTGEELNINGGSCRISVLGSTVKTATSEADFGGKNKKVEVNLNLNNNIVTLSSWKEIF
ncbi:MAG: hypothetical protein UV73_C0003G0123 [Candidatus Gottesmanbacteria bacterium GW2011_GWA2_43_14]|uniref:Type 4 fimbrial biogenesis protein PilX N-terminal domain-containing protein n=1 Tax=Candidatus Gottesmanbacteria bacterium GW2011_GWA2_43_14 TaxID=1618443 RepID=A0A0G1FT43_9BACT|nr:MAG: hypothetical protein UV73_C0003G0123 [Candidatus Gottesmanbacteria bacterium GW2011_GWA2_43_14]